MQDDTNPYESPLTQSTQPVPAGNAGKPFSNRAAKFSCYATLAAILFLVGTAAIRHPHLGTVDPVIVLSNLSLLANVAAIVFGIIGIMRGFRRGTIRSVLLATFAVLLNGGWLVFVTYLALQLCLT